MSTYKKSGSLKKKNTQFKQIINYICETFPKEHCSETSH